MKKIALFTLLLLIGNVAAIADIKLAVVDLNKAFDQYYKTKQVQQRLIEEINLDNKTLQDLQTDYQHQAEAAQELERQSKDTTLSQQARADKNDAFKKKVQDVYSLQKQIEDTRSSKANDLQNEKMQNHKRIIDEITKVVNDIAAAKGFDIVLDRSAPSVNGAPFLLYASPNLVDITNDIITKLNATAPPAGAQPPAGESSAATH